MSISTPSKRRRAEPPCHHFPLVGIWQPMLRSTGSVRLRPLDPDTPVAISVVAREPNGSIRLQSDRVYTVGRTNGRCEIALEGNRCISRRHCQLLLDGARRKLLLVDGSFSENYRGMCDQKECSMVRHSMNGVFVNGRRVSGGFVYELFSGDEVRFACAKRIHRGFRCIYGFVVESFAFFHAQDVLDERTNGTSEGFVMQSLCRDGPVRRAAILLSICRSILRSKDPISSIRRSLDADGLKKFRALEIFSKQTLLAKTSDSNNEKKNGALEVTSQTELRFIHLPNENVQLKDYSRNHSQEAVQYDVLEGRCTSRIEKDKDCGLPSDGRRFYLNRLKFMDPNSSECHTSISLPELFHPVRRLVRVFIATFTCDIEWFLSCCEVPTHLPITIACHNSEKCWSSSPNSRISIPYSDYPYLLSSIS